MNDAYSILGVNRNSTDEEVKNAYRELAKKYHPDQFTDNPLSDLAAEKMKELNEAYDTIMNERKANKGGYNSSADSDFADVRNMINSGRIDEAQLVLDGVPMNKRNAEWYFLSGSVQYKRGHFDEAYTSFATAARLNPQNPEYAAAFSRMQRQSGPYSSNPYRSAGNMGGSMDCCNCCSNLIIADCCCECMGGDLIPCC